MGVTASTIQRYEAGTIDNTKKMTLEGLADALHVSVEWLKGETDEYETDITDKRELQIRDAMTSILNKLPYDMEQSESDFSKDLDLCSLEKSHTINAFNDMGDIVRLYSKNPETAKNRLANLLSAKNPDSV